jgi:hypothetical protein
MGQAADAIALLDADHAELERLFQEYRALVAARAPAAERKQLADRACVELAMHGKLEDELFYPAAREALQDDDLLDDAGQQHDGTRDMAAQVLAMRADDELFDARVAVLHDYVSRHVRFEREQLFARLRNGRVDLLALGRALATRKAELQTVADALREDAIASAVASSSASLPA